MHNRLKHFEQLMQLLSPRLKLYQQIILYFSVITLVPLLGVSLIVYSINQQALKKELSRFTEHTAEALYKDFNTEVSWQRQQAESASVLLKESLASGQSFGVVAQRLFRLTKDLEAVGLYNRSGQLLHVEYRHFAALTPELRLPDDLATDALNQPLRVLYVGAGHAQSTPYFLQSILPLSKTIPLQKLPASEGGSSIVDRQPVFYVQQKRFPYIQTLVQAQSLYDAFYVIDSNGVIIAGTQGVEVPQRISEEDFQHFRNTAPGVTHEFTSTQTEESVGGRQTSSEQQNEDEEPPALKKVIVKMPDIQWGIMIESPYHVKQKYLKRAGLQTFTLIGGCLVIIILLAPVYVLGLYRNFRQLLKGIQALGDGNYFRRIRLITNVFTPYEIIYIALEFNRMAKRTADSWSAMQAANRQLAKMDEFKSNLIDTVSHELRTPLTNIKGYTSRLLRYDTTLDSESRVKSLKIIKQQADRLSRLVDDLLVIPDLENATLRIYPDQVSLLPLIERCVQLVQAKEHREIRVENISTDEIAPIEGSFLKEETPILVTADPDRLEQVVLNLLDNAVKYSVPQSPITVVVDGEGILEGRVRLTVRNQCDPIPMERLQSLDQLFEKFKRLDDSLVRTTRGSGLGLFITKALVEAMGGEIHLAYDPEIFSVQFTVPQWSDAVTHLEERQSAAEIAS